MHMLYTTACSDIVPGSNVITNDAVSERENNKVAKF